MGLCVGTVHSHTLRTCLQAAHTPTPDTHPSTQGPLAHSAVSTVCTHRPCMLSLPASYPYPTSASCCSVPVHICAAVYMRTNPIVLCQHKMSSRSGPVPLLSIGKCTPVAQSFQSAMPARVLQWLVSTLFIQHLSHSSWRNTVRCVAQLHNTIIPVSQTSLN
jgi:hypothetical protein